MAALGPACLLPTVTDVEGEQPGIYYSKGTWIWPDPGPYSTLSLSYDPKYPPLYLPGVDTTGAEFYRDQYKDPPISSPVPTVVVPGPTRVRYGYAGPGTYDGWAWTLNYGYAAPPGNDIIYGPDPGPPLGLNGLTPALMNETTDPLGNGIDSTPGHDGDADLLPAGLDDTGRARHRGADPDPEGERSERDRVRRRRPALLDA